MAGPFVGLLGLGHLIERRPEGRGWLKLGLIFLAGGAVLVGLSFTAGLYFWSTANFMVLLSLPLVWFGAAAVQAIDLWNSKYQPTRWLVHFLNLVSPGSCLLWNRPRREHMALSLLFMLVGAVTMSVPLLAGIETLEFLQGEIPNKPWRLWRFGAASTLVYALLALGLPFKRRWPLLS